MGNVAFLQFTTGGGEASAEIKTAAARTTDRQTSKLKPPKQERNTLSPEAKKNKTKKDDIRE